MQLLLVVFDSRLDTSELSGALLAGEESGVGVMPLLDSFCQAKDKEWWIKAFSQFCSKTANEEEEIVHKLLGDKFKVRTWWRLDVLKP